MGLRPICAGSSADTNVGEVDGSGCLPRIDVATFFLQRDADEPRISESFVIFAPLAWEGVAAVASVLYAAYRLGRATFADEPGPPADPTRTMPLPGRVEPATPTRPDQTAQRRISPVVVTGVLPLLPPVWQMPDALRGLPGAPPMTRTAPSPTERADIRAAAGDRNADDDASASQTTAPGKPGPKARSAEQELARLTDEIGRKKDAVEAAARRLDEVRAQRPIDEAAVQALATQLTIDAIAAFLLEIKRATLQAPAPMQAAQQIDLMRALRNTAHPVAASSIDTKIILKSVALKNDDGSPALARQRASPAVNRLLDLQANVRVGTQQMIAERDPTARAHIADNLRIDREQIDALQITMTPSTDVSARLATLERLVRTDKRRAADATTDLTALRARGVSDLDRRVIDTTQRLVDAERSAMTHELDRQRALVGDRLPAEREFELLRELRNGAHPAARSALLASIHHIESRLTGSDGEPLSRGTQHERERSDRQTAELQGFVRVADRQLQVETDEATRIHIRANRGLDLQRIETLRPSVDRLAARVRHEPEDED